MSEGKLVSMGIRLPKELLEAIEEKAKEENTDKSTVIRQILASAIKEHQKEKAAQLYKEGKITITAAAKIANLTIHEMIDYLIKSGYKIEYTIEDFRREIKLLK